MDNEMRRECFSSLFFCVQLVWSGGVHVGTTLLSSVTLFIPGIKCDLYPDLLSDISYLSTSRHRINHSHICQTTSGGSLAPAVSISLLGVNMLASIGSKTDILLLFFFFKAKCGSFSHNLQLLKCRFCVRGQKQRTRMFFQIPGLNAATISDLLLSRHKPEQQT